MDDIQVFRLIQKKYPVCTIVDARVFDDGLIQSKCKDKPINREFKVKDKIISVSLCTGSFNVYVISIEIKDNQ